MTAIVSEGARVSSGARGLSSIGEPPRLSAKRKPSQSSRALLNRQRQRILPSGVLEKILDTDVLLIRQRLLLRTAAGAQAIAMPSRIQSDSPIAAPKIQFAEARVPAENLPVPLRGVALR
jgi:hypothetical protein